MNEWALKKLGLPPNEWVIFSIFPYLGDNDFLALVPKFVAVNSTMVIGVRIFRVQLDGPVVIPDCLPVVSKVAVDSSTE